MSVHIQGTANPNPVTQVSEPSSPITGSTLTAGTQGNFPVGPFTNNSSVALKITALAISNQVNCTANPPGTLPVTVQPGASTNLEVYVTALAAGAYSFDVAETWST